MVIILMFLLFSTCCSNLFKKSITVSARGRNNASMSHSLPFLPLKNMELTGSKVLLAESQQTRVTLTTTTPFYRTEKNIFSFTVKFDKKQRKTAIGFSATRPPSDTYLIPDYYSGGDYVSMGGAGFIYPMRDSASRGYKVGYVMFLRHFML